MIRKDLEASGEAFEDFTRSVTLLCALKRKIEGRWGQKVWGSSLAKERGESSRKIA